jgi:CheY-like chemotaxis protein
MKTLDCILLIEDDDTTNFYNQFLIEKMGIAKEVAVTLNGQDALDYLERAGRGEAVTPELILLDINMPVMNGFEFIEAYEQLPNDNKSKILVVMLTTSLHPDDIARAKAHPSIKEYFYKPLLKDKLGDLMEKYF